MGALMDCRAEILEYTASQERRKQGAKAGNYHPHGTLGRYTLRLIVYHISPGMESYLPIAPRPDAALRLQGENKVGGPL